MIAAICLVVLVVFVLVIAICPSGVSPVHRYTKDELLGGYRDNNRIQGMLTKKEFEEVLERRFRRNGSYNRWYP